MKAWSYDGQDFIPDEEAGRYIYRNKDIDRYLNILDRDKHFILIGPKGIGKTLLLRYKAYLYWRRDNPDAEEKGVKKSPGANELVENIVLAFHTFSQDDINRFGKRSLWKRIWMFSILLFILRPFLELETVPDDLQPFLKKRGRLASIVNRLLVISNTDLNKCLGHLPFLIDEAAYMQSGSTVFIDRLDQGLDTFLSEEDYSYWTGSTENPVIKLWRNAQTGLLEAIYDINGINTHIKVFASCRQEAELRMEGALAQNITNFCIKLKYNKEELQQIFINNIRLMKKKELIKPEAEDEIEQFLGFSQMTHPVVLDIKQNKRTESAFDFIYRHTYGRPREIVRLGAKIYSELVCKNSYKNASEADKVAKVRTLVNSFAHDNIFRNYQYEIIPRFNELGFEQFATEISGNVITNGERESFNQDILNYLYRLGLIGHTKTVIGREYEYEQCFLPIASYTIGNKEVLPHSDFYFTHPTIDKYLENNLDYFQYYNSFNIIGNGNPFYEPPKLYQLSLFSGKVEEYSPKETVGNSWEKPLRDKVFQHGLQAYYEAFFKRTISPNVDKFRLSFIKDLSQMLNNVALIYLLQELKQERPHTADYDELKNKTQHELQGELGNKSYSNLSSPEVDESLYKFGMWQQLRLVVAVSLLVLELDILTVHRLILDNDTRLRPSKILDTSAVSYLKDQFYFRHLGVTNRGNKELYGELSDFEKEFIKAWWTFFIDTHLENNKEWFSIDDQNWLTYTFISKRKKLSCLP